MKIIQNTPPTENEVTEFLSRINFLLPNGYIDFMKSTNGAEVYLGEEYLLLWQLTDLFDLNKEYAVDTFIPDFFLFGSNGSDTAFAIEKETGKIFEMPFIGMSKEESVYRFDDFNIMLSYYTSHSVQ